MQSIGLILKVFLIVFSYFVTNFSTNKVAVLIGQAD